MPYSVEVALSRVFIYLTLLASYRFKVGGVVTATPSTMCLSSVRTCFAALIAVITVEPADKISFVYNCMQTRLRGQYNGK